jgi:hypothetical protein
MVIDVPNEWISEQYPTSTLQVPDKLPTSSPAILSLIKTLDEQQLSIKSIC